MNEETKELFRISISNASDETLLKEIPSSISVFNLMDNMEYTSLVSYLKIIVEELESREGSYEKVLGSFEDPYTYWRDILTPRWINAIQSNGVMVFEVLKDASLLNFVVNNLSQVLNCERNVFGVMESLIDKKNC